MCFGCIYFVSGVSNHECMDALRVCIYPHSFSREDYKIREDQLYRTPTMTIK